jgi:serine/threonine-protein kinase
MSTQSEDADRTVLGEYIGADVEVARRARTDLDDGERSSPPTTPEERYDDRGLIGRGGQGEVRRVFDRHVGRILAMKVLSFERLNDAPSHARFWHEARVTANLEHPAIVSVHDMGTLADGRPYFTMSEVRGETFGTQIERLHELTDPVEQGHGLRRLVQSLVRVSEGLAYAHSHRIIHRDLKPQNLMVGAFGEVLIMDWGLAGKVVADTDGTPSDMPFEAPHADAIVESLDRHRAVTQDGSVRGTIAYMAPEQARGRRAALGPWTDVYALGAVLYKILTGQAPYGGSPARALRTLLAGAPTSIASFPPSALRPAPLVRICERAMARERDRRFGDASELVRAFGAWLDDTERHDRARVILERADRLWHGDGGIAPLRARERALRRQADRALAKVSAHAPVHRKKPGWAIQQKAEALSHEVALRIVEWRQTLRSALEEVPDHPEVHRRLAAFYRDQLDEADKARDRNEASRAEALLRIHDRGEHAAFLRGHGRLSLRSDPPARVQLYRYADRHGRLVPERVGELGTTPLVDIELPGGSYLLVLRAHGCQKVRYPVLVPRAGAWTGSGPDGEPFVLRLPRRGELEPDEVFVPAGPFVAGGDPNAAESLSRREIWLPSFVISRHPVTCEAYRLFLDALVDAGREEEALRHAPKQRLGRGRDGLTPVWGRDSEGHFVIADSQELPMAPRHPVTLVDWHDAQAYAAWARRRSGKAWRLPGELEWEKAARGVDGRFLPWGDMPEITFANLLGIDDGNPAPCPVDDDHRYRHDRSPYGVRGMAGNVRDWCEERWTTEGPDLTPDDDKQGPSPLRCARGGSWMTDTAWRPAARFAGPGDITSIGLGFRLARSF